MGRERETELARGHSIKIEAQGQMTQDRGGRSGDGCSSEEDTNEEKRRRKRRTRP